MTAIDEAQGVHAVLDLFGKIDVSLGNLDRHMAEQRRAQERWRALQESPKYMRIHAQVTLDANGFGVLKFDNDGPDTGRMWYLRKLAIGGLTPATTVAGRADTFVSAMDYRRFTTLAQCGVQDWVDQAATLPLVGDFSAGEVVVQHQEQLFVIVSGGTATQSVQAVGLVQDFQTGSYKSDWAL